MRLPEENTLGEVLRMQLNESTLELLRDEAYVSLCREAVQERLALTAQQKATLAGTRPPFGVLARRETRETFANSMRMADVEETGLRDNMARIARLDDWLQPLIRGNLVSYLDQASPDFNRFPQIMHQLHEWERALYELSDMLTAFARDMRTLREAAGAAMAGGRHGAQELRVVRDIAVRLEECHQRLARAEATLAEHTAHLGLSGLQMPKLLELRRVAWVSRLGVTPLDQVALEVTRVEGEVRAYLNGGVALAAARLNASREMCEEAQENFLQSYWNQLRAHAQAHYVEECDVDEILTTLVERYMASDQVRRQEALAHEPFLAER